MLASAATAKTAARKRPDWPWSRATTAVAEPVAIQAPAVTPPCRDQRQDGTELSRGAEPQHQPPPARPDSRASHPSEATGDAAPLDTLVTSRRGPDAEVQLPRSVWPSTVETVVQPTV